MSDSSKEKEKRPVILSLVPLGTPEYPRYVIADQYLRYWTGDSWTEQKDDAHALVYANSNDALHDMNKLLMVDHEKKQVKRYRAPMYIDLYSDGTISKRELQMWLLKATKLIIDSPKHGNGPIAGSLGSCRINFGELEEYKNG